MRVGTFSAAAIALLSALCAVADAQTGANGVVTTDLGASRLLEITDKTCYQHGDDRQGLEAEVAKVGFREVSGDELLRRSSQHLQIIGGWTLKMDERSYAISQALFRNSRSDYVCTVTAPGSFTSWEQVSRELVARYGAVRTHQFDDPGRHVERFSLRGKHGKDVLATVTYLTQNDLVTISVFHGPGFTRLTPT